MEAPKKKVYIAGKVTGLPKSKVINTFRLAERLLLENGFDVINPIEVVSLKAQGFDTPWDVAMRHCIKAMMNCDSVFVLYNWENSKGARVEVELAKHLQIPVFKEIEKIIEYDRKT